MEVSSSNILVKRGVYYMKKMRYWGILIAFFALILNPWGILEANAATVTNTPTTSILQESEPTLLQEKFQLAQGVIGQCRAANRTMDVFSQASVAPQSLTVTTLQTNAQMTLADNGSAGWIRISAPVGGYVIARYLKPCSGTVPPPPPPQGLCRNATVELNIRQSPSTSATVIGGVPANGTVKLASPKNSQTDSEGRNWVQIAAPIGGWVSSGFPDGNLGPEFSCR